MKIKLKKNIKMPVRKRELLISEYINQNTKVVELVFAECR